MGKIFLILGLVIGAAVAGGASYLVSAKMKARPEKPAASELEPTVDYLLAQAKLARSQRRINDAIDYCRRSIKLSATPRERARSGYKMGQMMMEDWRNGGDSSVEAAILYLTAARDISDVTDDRLEIGREVLDALFELGKMKEYERFLTEIMAQTEDPKELTDLWRRQLQFLLDKDDGWPEMSRALNEASSLAIDLERWNEMLADLKLRAQEKALKDRVWFDAYVAENPTLDPDECRQVLFDKVEPQLEELFKNMDLKHRAEVRIRLAAVHLAMRHIDEAYQLLARFVEMEPQDNLAEAILLLGDVAGMSGNATPVIPLVQELVESKSFYRLKQEEVLLVARELEQLGLLDDAIHVVQDRLNEVDLVIGKRVELLACAAELEEQAEHREVALNYMNQLESAEAARALGKALTGIVSVDLERGDYEGAEFWVERFLDSTLPGTDDFSNALYALFEAKYWLGRPVAEQLYVGSVAIQNYSKDPRTPQVELSMGKAIEKLGLYELAISYYNRIGLLQLFQGDFMAEGIPLGVDEEAVLGKARCLSELEDWVAVDHLYRDVCRRTRSPLIKSEAAVRWAELALQNGQKVEAKRRYALAHVQLLPPTERVRHLFGTMDLNEGKSLLEDNYVRSQLNLLSELPENEQRQATVTFFNNVYEFLLENGSDQSVQNLIDLACQSPHKDWIPIENYMLRACAKRAPSDELASLGDELHKMENVSETTLGDLTQMIDKLGEMNELVK